MTLLGEIVEKDGMLCLQTRPGVWYPLDGASGIAEDFRETFNRAQKSDIGKRLHKMRGGAWRYYRTLDNREISA